MSIELLEASRPLGPWTKYEDHILTNKPADISVKFISGAARDQDLGVDAIHGRDSLDRLIGINPKKTPEEKLRLTERFAERVQRHHIALVRTILEDTESPLNPQEREAADILNSVTTLFIATDPTTLTPDPSRSRIVPFADLSERFIGFPKKARIPGRIAAISSGETGDAATRFLSIAPFSRVPDISVRLIGEHDGIMREPLRFEPPQRTTPTSSRVGKLSDAALLEEITEAEFVALPGLTQYDDLHMALLALSLDRYVIASHSPRLDALASDVGPGWVQLIDGTLTARKMDAAILHARKEAATTHPDLTNRTMRAVAAAFSTTIRDAVAMVQSDPNSPIQ